MSEVVHPLLQKYPHLRVVFMLGRTGVGKSNFINFLSGGRFVKVGHNVEPETEKCEGVIVHFKDVPILLVDCPGLGDPRSREGRDVDSKHVFNIFRLIKQLGVVHKFLFFVPINERMGIVERRFLQLLYSALGKSFTRKVSLILTKCTADYKKNMIYSLEEKMRNGEDDDFNNIVEEVKEAVKSGQEGNNASVLSSLRSFLPGNGLFDFISRPRKMSSKLFDVLFGEGERVFEIFKVRKMKEHVEAIRKETNIPFPTYKESPVFILDIPLRKHKHRNNQEIRRDILQMLCDTNRTIVGNFKLPKSLDMKNKDNDEAYGLKNKLGKLEGEKQILDSQLSGTGREIRMKIESLQKQVDDFDFEISLCQNVLETHDHEDLILVGRGHEESDGSYWGRTTLKVEAFCDSPYSVVRKYQKPGCIWTSERQVRRLCEGNIQSEFFRGVWGTIECYAKSSENHKKLITKNLRKLDAWNKRRQKCWRELNEWVGKKANDEETLNKIQVLNDRIRVLVRRINILEADTCEIHHYLEHFVEDEDLRRKYSEEEFEYQDIEKSDRMMDEDDDEEEGGGGRKNQVLFHSFVPEGECRLLVLRTPDGGKVNVDMDELIKTLNYIRDMLEFEGIEEETAKKHGFIDMDVNFKCLVLFLSLAFGREIPTFLNPSNLRLRTLLECVRFMLMTNEKKHLEQVYNMIQKWVESHSQEISEEFMRCIDVLVSIKDESMMKIVKILANKSFEKFQSLKSQIQRAKEEERRMYFEDENITGKARKREERDDDDEGEDDDDDDGPQRKKRKL